MYFLKKKCPDVINEFFIKIIKSKTGGVFFLVPVLTKTHKPLHWQIVGVVRSQPSIFPIPIILISHLTLFISLYIYKSHFNFWFPPLQISLIRANSIVLSLSLSLSDYCLVAEKTQEKKGNQSDELFPFRFFTYYTQLSQIRQAEISTDEIFLRFEANQTARKNLRRFENLL